jgi:hypothetical protein
MDCHYSLWQVSLYPLFFSLFFFFWLIPFGMASFIIILLFFHRPYSLDNFWREISDIEFYFDEWKVYMNLDHGCMKRISTVVTTIWQSSPWIQAAYDLGFVYECVIWLWSEFWIIKELFLFYHFENEISKCEVFLRTKS